MAKTNKIILVIVAVVCIAVGFAVGQVVQASFNSPGSENDPLVSQSYVETIVGERTAALQTQIEELQTQLTALTGGGSTTTAAASSNSSSATTSTTTTPEQTADSGKTVNVTGNSVNVRSAANTSASVVGQVSKGDKITYIGEDGDWYKVKLSDGTEGYIASWLGTVN